MGYWLGIDVGSTFTAAAVCRGQDGQWGPPEVVSLGGRSAAVSSVVFLGEGGQVLVGDAAERRAVTDPDRVVRGFKRRIGDDVPLVVGGVAYAAPEIAAKVVRWVVDQVAAREGGPAADIVLTHPAGWGTYKVEVLTRALGEADLGHVRFATEPEAAAAGYAVQERIEPGRTVAVYDLGGGTFDAAVVRKTSAGEFSLLGQPQGLEQLGGVDFDDAVFAHVLAAVPALAQLDGEDPAVLAAIAALRRECTEAKEALSVDTEVTIPVLAPGIQSQVRLVRAEFEDMIRSGVSETVQALRRTLTSAHLKADELDVVLLVGGSSRVPLVTQLVSAELGRPVAVDADPKAAIALGAAVLALPIDHTAADQLTNGSTDSRDHPAEPAAEPTTQLPERPSLNPVPLDLDGADLEGNRTNSQRVRQVAIAGALALVTAAVVAAIPFLVAHSEPTPPESAVAAPSSAPPAPSGPQPPAPRPDAGSHAEVGGDASHHRAGSGWVIRTPSLAAPNRPAPGGPPAAPQESSKASVPPWVTDYTWTSSWSSPPPSTAPPSTSAATPSTTHTRTTTPSSAPPATTKDTPTATITTGPRTPDTDDALTTSPYPRQPRT